MCPVLDPGSEALTGTPDPYFLVHRPAAARYFAQLEVLQLGFNHITDMAQLGLEQLPELKVLDLHGNDIQRICGLSYSSCLRELVLDKNKIKAFDASSFVGLGELRELRLQVRGRCAAQCPPCSPCVVLFALPRRAFFALLFDAKQENGLKSLAYIEHLESLQVLTVGHNRIGCVARFTELLPLLWLLHSAVFSSYTLALWRPLGVGVLVAPAFPFRDLAEVDRLSCLTCLTELWMNANAASRKQMYRPFVIRRIPSLMSLDGT